MCILFLYVPFDSLWPISRWWPVTLSKVKNLKGNQKDHGNKQAPPIYRLRTFSLMVWVRLKFAAAQVVWSWKGFHYEIKGFPSRISIVYYFPVLETISKTPRTVAMKPSWCLMCTASESSNWSGTMRRDRDTLFWSFGSVEGCSQLVRGAEKFLGYQSLVLYVPSFEGLVSCCCSGLGHEV